MIRLCLFDLDGTTINSLPAIAHFANRILAANSLPTFPVDDYRHFAGGGAAKLWRSLAEATGAPQPLTDAMREEWIRTYAADPLYQTEAFEGIPQMLSALKRHGICTAVITNKDERIAAQICDRLFAGLLDGYTCDHPGVKLKPDPGQLLAMMRRFHAQPEETLYCGDHQIDMETGRRAGVKTVGVTWGFHTREMLLDAGADLVADEPMQIARWATGQTAP